MSGLVGWIKENILSMRVYKVIFTDPLDADHVLGHGQVYFKPSEKTITYQGHDFSIDLKDCVRQQGNRFLQYRDFETGAVLKFYNAKAWKKPNGEILSSKELNAARAADVAKAVAVGGQLQAGLVLLILCVVVGLLGGALLGYFGLPSLTGQVLVPNVTPVPVG